MTGAQNYLAPQEEVCKFARERVAKREEEDDDDVDEEAEEAAAAAAAFCLSFETCATRALTFCAFPFSHFIGARFDDAPAELAARIQDKWAARRRARASQIGAPRVIGFEGSLARWLAGVQFQANSTTAAAFVAPLSGARSAKVRASSATSHFQAALATRL